MLSSSHSAEVCPSHLTEAKSLSLLSYDSLYREMQGLRWKALGLRFTSARIFIMGHFSLFGLLQQNNKIGSLQHRNLYLRVQGKTLADSVTGGGCSSSVVPFAMTSQDGGNLLAPCGLLQRVLISFTRTEPL